ncbi:MAG: hypothetical protein Q7T55_02425 [Solirubrobacteraceae bacterium]|nr:hypothetical protein [Solirubrobacteraceae bacterium]
MASPIKTPGLRPWMHGLARPGPGYVWTVHEFIETCGFLGGWLLVAGPIYQASIELREEAFERDAMMAAASSIPPEPEVSGWWWFLPPVYWWLSRRRRARMGEKVLVAMTPEQREQFVNYMAKAFGWMLVAGGAFFIATKETYEFVEAWHWHVAVFWVLVVVMPILAFAYTAASSIRSRRMLDPGFVPERGPRVGRHAPPTDDA